MRWDEYDEGRDDSHRHAQLIRLSAGGTDRTHGVFLNDAFYLQSNQRHDPNISRRVKRHRMDLVDPFPAYNAANNIEAMLVQQFLESHGIDAYAVEDASGIGIFAWGGGLNEIHKPQVWISRNDEQRVAELLTEYEQQKLERDAERHADEAKTIEADCESCGKTSTFAGTLNGTTQLCTHCGAYVDVGEFDWPYDDDFGEEGASTAEDA